LIGLLPTKNFAHSLYDESLAIAREIGDKELIALSLEGLAHLVAMQGEPTWAACLWGTAEALREAIGAPLQPIERADYEQTVMDARDHLDKETFTAAWRQGRFMTAEQALSVGEHKLHTQHFQLNQPPR
jgi:hypothetical protein